MDTKKVKVNQLSLQHFELFGAEPEKNTLYLTH